MDHVPPGGQGAEMSRLLDGLVGLPLGHDLVAACRMKTVACVTSLLVNGVPRDSLGIAANLVPDMSAEGMVRAYDSGHVMHKEPTAFSRHSFGTRLNHHPGVVDADRSEVVLDGAIRVRGEQNSQGPGVRVQSIDAGPGWWLSDPAQPGQQFANHFAAVRFHPSADGGESVPMVYDPGYDTRTALTLTEWKARQGYPDSVTSVARLGGPYQLHLESMSDSQRARLADVLDLDDETSTAAMADRLGALAPAEHRDLLMTFFRFPPDDGQQESQTPLASYARDLRDLIVVEDAMPGMDRDPAAVLHATLRDLAPLAAYERWLHDSDARIRLTAPNDPAAALRTAGITMPRRTERWRSAPADRPAQQR